MNEKVLINLESWKKSLLDISNRSSSINFRRRKTSTVQIMHPSIHEFLNESISSRGVTFAELFDDEEDDDDPSSTLDDSIDEYVKVLGFRLPKKESYSLSELSDIIAKYIQKKRGNYLFSDSNNHNQRKALRNLMKKARSFKEENAVNVLYFAVGYLEWFESKDSDIHYRAPLAFIAAEITQDSFDAPFKVSFPDGELLLNDSLIQKMINDFGLDFYFDFNSSDLPLSEIYENYKKFVIQKVPDKRWNIIDEMDIGIFSFSKINMVKDLEENAQKIAENILIQQISGVNEVSQTNIPFNEEQIDQVINPKEYFHILDADSSQEIAIQSAIAGTSFVLQGPPGTGKSQTITNIITELIARGKKVLFVAEKKAALDVVYKNLKKIGLNDYALPIHNSKLDKKVVLQELASTLEKGQNPVKIEAEFFESKVAQFVNSRNGLIDYAHTLLEKRYPIGKNMYQLYGTMLKYQRYPNVQFSLDKVSEISEEKLLEYETIINGFAHAFSGVQHSPEKHIWHGISHEEMSISEKERLYDTIRKFNESIKKGMDIASRLVIKSEAKEFIPSLISISSVISHLFLLKRIDEKIVNNPMLGSDINNYQKMIEWKTNFDMLYEELWTKYDSGIIALDTNHLGTIIKANRSIIRRVFSKEYKVARSDILHYYKLKKIGYKELVKNLSDINYYKTLQENLQKAHNQVFYKTSIDDLSSLKEALYDLEWYRDFLTLTDLKTTGISPIIDALTLLREYLVSKNNNDRVANEFVAQLEDIKVTLADCQNYFSKDKIDFFTLSYANLNDKLNAMLNGQRHLDSLLDFNRAVKRCEEAGLTDYCSKVIREHQQEKFFEIFLRRFYLLLANKYLSDFLPGFNGADLDKIREGFANAENYMSKMAKVAVEQRIIARIPNYNGLEGYNSEVTTLRVEASKSRKILPFRVLFSKIPNLILKLKPCLMMSPLSVATFLKSSGITFDTVIFDEASQVKPENAIGAIFRAKQFIIAGDREQLPPTNFFQTIAEDDDFINENLDTSSFDSILELSGSYLSSIKLRWHYRSRFEELIRPSNKEIYKDLITFPSPSKPTQFEAIQFVHVNGVYADRRNEAEADKVIETIAGIIDKHGTNGPSIGVVTFNLEQQTLIEKKINHFRKSHPDYEEFFVNNESEPFFVKNIETVQGDERDIIIISIGYGPDAKGKTSMNFGPLNQAHGYRRLNVAVTRAKTSLILITSIKSADIDLNKTRARGVEFLKHYLEYAEHGEDEKVDIISEEAWFDSPFEEDVYNELTQLGYTVKKQVGCSGYRIDLAIVNPNNPAHFLLGIECDGATYHSSRSVRDRDRLRQQVLEARKWTIHRIWSTDWIRNKQNQIKRITDCIKNLHIGNGSVSPIRTVSVPVVPVQKTKEEISFAEYPNYDSLLTIRPSKYVNSPFVGKVLEIIIRTSPIHFSELKKIVPALWNRQKYTSVVENEIRPIIRYLINQNEIIMKDDFLIYRNAKITFRKTGSSSSRRPFECIHPDELSDGIIRILKIARTINVDKVISIIANYCNYVSVSLNIRIIMLEILNGQKTRLAVSICDDIVKLI